MRNPCQVFFRRRIAEIAPSFGWIRIDRSELCRNEKGGAHCATALDLRVPYRLCDLFSHKFSKHQVVYHAYNFIGRSGFVEQEILGVVQLHDICVHIFVTGDKDEFCVAMN